MLRIKWWRGLGLSPPVPITCVHFNLSVGHSPQRWSDISSVSPQNLQVNGIDSLHLDRCPAKRSWLAAACIRVVRSFVLIHLVFFLCCVVGKTKKALADPHLVIIFHHCCHLCSTNNFISFLISPSVRKAGYSSWTATAFFLSPSRPPPCSL